MARPRVVDRESITEAVCADISSGQLVRIACETHGTTPQRLREWCVDDPMLASQYARARAEQAHALADDALAIADESGPVGRARLAEMVASIEGVSDDDKAHLLRAMTREAVQRDRLRVDTRKWLASKIAPKLYGEKLQTEISGPDGGPVQIWSFGERKVSF